MQNHFDCGYEFVTETGEKRYIAFVDYDDGVPHYDTYPIEIREQLDANSDLLFDYDFVDKHRICMEEHELYMLRIQELEKQLKMGKISVETPIGTLTACIGGDPNNYPEIFTYITRPDDVEIDLVAVEIKKEERFARAYLYGDTATDAYTNTHDWSEIEIDINVDTETIVQRCNIAGNEYPERFLGKIAAPTDCMRDADYWTYPVSLYEVIQAKPELMDDQAFNNKYACRLNAAQWLMCRLPEEEE
jgi:hypothetical protein